MYDCIVIGAGPAGGTAAYHLAKRGRSVLVLEKATLPRYKPCGGAVSPVVAQWFDFDFSPVISLKVDRVRYTWKSEDPVEVTLKTSQPMWMVRRDRFDHFLIEQAVAQGAEVQDGTEVTGISFAGDAWQVKTATGTLTGRYLIAADGAKGKTSEWLKLKPPKRRSAIALEVNATSIAPESAIIAFDFGRVKNGFIWNFPKADGYSLGLSTFLGKDANDLRQLGMEYLQASGLPTNGTASQVFEDSLCLWDGDRPLHAQNALVVGEAAAMVDPLNAEGIRPSMYSGLKAAEAIDRALGGDAGALADYTQVMQTEWGAEMKWAQRLAGAFYRFPGISYKAGVKKPATTQVMLQVLCGEKTYSEIADLALKRLSGSFLPGRGKK